jgi:hypothetical protein
MLCFEVVRLRIENLCDGYYDQFHCKLIVALVNSVKTVPNCKADYSKRIVANVMHCQLKCLLGQALQS